MRNDFYPEGLITALLETDRITPATSEVLRGRLLKNEVRVPGWLSDELYETLKAACARLIPQTRERPVDLPGLLDEQLTSGSGNGWRYASMPADSQAVILGLTGMNETAVLLFGTAFHLLNAPEQDTLLQAVQDGTAEGMTWEQLPAQLFFKELLSRLAEIYYSHPFAKEEIGDVSSADAKGWNRLGLDQLEDIEPAPLQIST